MKTASVIGMLIAVMVFIISVPAAAHNWHQEFTHWSGAGTSSVSNFSSSTGGATGSFTVMYGSPGTNQLYQDNNRARFDVSTSGTQRFRFGSDLASSVRPETGAAVGWRMQKTRTNVQRGPIQFCLPKVNGEKWTTFIVVTGSQIIPKMNDGSDHPGVDARSYSVSGMTSYSLAGRESGGWVYWKLWVNGSLVTFTGSNGGSGKTNPWGQSYSFRSQQDGTNPVGARIGLGELGNSPFIGDWGWLFEWVRWTDQGDAYFGEPYFHSNPAGQTKNIGETATLSVATWSGGTVTYQWQVRTPGGEWTNISGATGSSYTTPPLQADDDGNQYRCRARRDSWPLVASQPATLTISCIAPSITGHPQSQTICEGEPVTFSVTATGTTPLSYQWFKDAQDEIVGATSSSYTIDSVSWADVGGYHCEVTNICGEANSDAAVLMVNVAPSITLQPQNASVIEGSSVNLTVEAEGSPPLSYQWRKSGSDIIDANSNIYTIDSAQLDDSGNYDCVVTNMCGMVTSDAAILVVEPPIFALGLSNLGVGGGDWNYDANTGAGQKGVTGGIGLSTTGLLVRTWGIVTYAADEYFYIDDGSDLDDGSGNSGVKVEVLAGIDVPELDSYVVVTGISSCYSVGDERYPVIRVRKQTDVSVVQ